MEDKKWQGAEGEGSLEPQKAHPTSEFNNYACVVANGGHLLLHLVFSLATVHGE